MTTKHSESDQVCSTSLPDDETSSSIEELAALYAVGALTDSERTDVELRMAIGDEILLAAVRGWNEVVVALGTTLEPATPDPRIKAALLARLQPEQTKQATRESDGHSVSDARSVIDARIPAQIVHRADGAGWRSAGSPGASMRVLNADRKQGRLTTLMKIEPGCRFPAHPHHGDEECLVISGDMLDGDLMLGPGDYVRSAAGTHHDELTTRTGCVCLLLSALIPHVTR